VNEQLRWATVRSGEGCFTELIERMAGEGWVLRDPTPMPVFIDGVRFDQFAFVPAAGAGPRTEDGRPS
jgi:hypothetical protein